MKKLIFLFTFLLINSQLDAQEKVRIVVDGNINMPEGEDAQGISIFNLNTQRGTVSNLNGAFKLRVGVNDSIRISAVQFQEFTVVINEGVMESGKLNINVTEVGNVLPEIIVSPYDLTGNVNVDIARLQVVRTPDTLNAMQVQSMYFAEDAAPDFQSPPRNTALEMHQSHMENGLNFANLFKYLLVTTRRQQVEKSTANLDSAMRQLYSDAFFREYLDIKRENITDFIFFADENGLTEPMLREGNELDLIDFLVEQSKRYKRQKARN